MENIVQESRAFVKNIFATSSLETLHYHNWKHVKMVRKAVLEIAENTPEITEEQKEVLELAAWFHDIGYEDNYEDHEAISAEKANGFLKEKGYPEEKITLVKDLILATNIHHSPKNILEEIIKDADLVHLAKKNYCKTTFMDLYNEIKATKIPSLTIPNWVDMCREFLEKHE